MATAKAKKTTAKITDIEVDTLVNKVKKGAKDVNNFVLEQSEAIIEDAVVRGEQWQGVATKAIKGGLKLTANSQDMMFDTLEELKGQLKNSTSRLKTLFSKN